MNQVCVDASHVSAVTQVASSGVAGRIALKPTRTEVTEWMDTGKLSILVIEPFIHVVFDLHERRSRAANGVDHERKALWSRQVSTPRRKGQPQPQWSDPNTKGQSLSYFPPPSEIITIV